MSRISRRTIVLGFPVAALAAGCGRSPTAESAGGPSGNASKQESLQEVYTKVKGLTGDERRQKLIDLATDEGGSVRLYTSINEEITQKLLDQFTEETGLNVDLYRAANQDILQRVREEEKAGYSKVADVIANNDIEQVLHARDGVLSPLKSPVTERNVEVHDTWAAVDRFVYIAAWNTKSVTGRNAPTSWKDVFNADYPGGLAYQYGDFAWFATLINDYYVKKKGMTEREAVEMVKSGVRRNGHVVDGHTLGANLLAAGEYGVASSLYYYRVVTLMEQGAPIAWEPAVEPLIVRSTGAGMHHRSRRPASALLLTEFMLTDMQRVLPKFNKTPALKGVPGGPPGKYDPIPMDLDLVIDNADKWQKLHEQVTRAIGGEVRDE